MIIAMNEGVPAIAPEKEATCYKCQHCLAVCPTGAISILGLKPGNSIPLASGYPEPDKLETLIKGRRSVRRYKDENLDPALLDRLLEVAWHAPTGVNSRQVLFTVIDNKDDMALLRDEVMAGLERLVASDALPESMAFYGKFLKLWQEKKVDILFRGAPHFLIASTPQHLASPAPDCLIALSYFELFAQANKVGTVWNGLAKWAINDLLPETRARLGIPADHLVGYAMSFGKPAVQYARTVQHTPPLVNRFRG
jgi:nitroreductase